MPSEESQRSRRKCLYTTGFPSPAEDEVEARLSLDDLLIRHPVTTFFLLVQGNALARAGIHSGDLLVVDRSRAATRGRLVVVTYDGQLVVRRLDMHQGRLQLVTCDPADLPLPLSPEQPLRLWGVATHVIHPLLEPFAHVSSGWRRTRFFDPDVQT